MRKFFKLFGTKYGAADRYVMPQRAHIVEPFAGAAGYSTWWSGTPNERYDVTLVDIDERICAVWDYLIHAKPKHIRALPLFDQRYQRISDLRIDQEAKWLLGYWSDARPNRPSDANNLWGTWSEEVRECLAFQVTYIKHWKIMHGSYESAPDVDAHWHIDPPYVIAGKKYPHNAVDYAALARWCRTRRGFVQVCESSGAQWLPFEHMNNKAGNTWQAPEGWGTGEAVLESGQRVGFERDLDPTKEGVRRGNSSDGNGTGKRQRHGTVQERRPAAVAGEAGAGGEQVRRRRLEAVEDQDAGVAKQRHRRDRRTYGDRRLRAASATD